MVVSGFVDGAIEQDEVSPVASDVEVLNGNKSYGLDSESRREGRLGHFHTLSAVVVVIGWSLVGIVDRVVVVVVFAIQQTENDNDGDKQQERCGL